MPTKTLTQVASYIDPALKELLDKKLKRLGNRMSVSSYIEGLLRKDLNGKDKAA